MNQQLVYSFLMMVVTKKHEDEKNKRPEPPPPPSPLCFRSPRPTFIDRSPDFWTAVGPLSLSTTALVSTGSHNFARDTLSQLQGIVLVLSLYLCTVSWYYLMVCTKVVLKCCALYSKAFGWVGGGETVELKCISVDWLDDNEDCSTRICASQYIVVHIHFIQCLFPIPVCFTKKSRRVLENLPSQTFFKQTEIG